MSTSKKKALRLLIVALAIVICGSFLANLFNTSFYSVSVSRVKFDTANGTLSGLLYLPKGAGANDPRPTVVLTHGYLNSAEMQDANAIELSRRGYAVLDIDMYDHGHSNIDDAAYGGNTSFFALWAPFWINSINDAVQYAYEQPYVLKDANGNGIIGVTGHSMGGFSSTMAVVMDEKAFAATGVRKISCSLTEGSDFSYSGFFGADIATFDAAGGGRVLGKVAAEFDEFFFNDPATEGGTVRQKNYVATPEGLAFLQQESAQPNTWYATSDGGQRIVYQPHQTHPWNHFSKTTTGYAIDFYTKAFENYQTGIKSIASSNQIWQLKEAAECVALVGFVLFIIALALVLADLPFFRKVKTGAVAAVRSTCGVAGKACMALITIAAILLPAILFETLYDGNPASTGMKIVFWAALALTVCGVAWAAFRLVKGGDKKRYILGAVFTAVAGLMLISKSSLYGDAAFWTAPVVNDVAKWTIGSAMIALMILSLVFVFFKAKDGAGLSAYGVKLNPLAIVAGICTAVVTVAAAYALLFLVDLVFKTDFRIWTFAFKTFDCDIVPAILRYLPTFLLYYLISTAAIAVNTSSLKAVPGYLLAAALNAGGIAIWLIRQYATLFATGVAAHPGAALSGIVLVAMVPTLAIAACISRAIVKKTGNIWTAACLNALLMTIMSVANTCVWFR